MSAVTALSGGGADGQPSQQRASATATPSNRRKASVHDSALTRSTRDPPTHSAGGWVRPEPGTSTASATATAVAGTVGGAGGASAQPVTVTVTVTVTQPAPLLVPSPVAAGPKAPVSPTAAAAVADANSRNGNGGGEEYNVAASPVRRGSAGPIVVTTGGGGGRKPSLGADPTGSPLHLGRTAVTATGGAPPKHQSGGGPHHASDSVSSNGTPAGAPPGLMLHERAPRQLLIFARPHHLWGLGIVIVLGGQYIGWNAGLASGFWSFMIATVLIGLAYLNMCFALAEMASAIPFAGGSYGYARAVIGKFAGFFVGCAESLEYIVYVAVTAFIFAQAITSIAGTPVALEPVWWLLFYVVSVVIHVAGGSAFWTFNFVFAVVIVAIEVFYWLGCAAFFDFHKYAPWPGATTETQKWFVDGTSGFVAGLPLAMWWYIGIEAVPLAAEETHSPKKGVPKGMIWGMVTLFVMSVITCVATASSPPGIDVIAGSLLPFNYGFQKLFGGSLELQGLMSMPALFATGFGFVFCYGRQVFAMARSGLLPDVLSTTYAKRGTPHVAMITGSVIGYAICLLGYLFMDAETFTTAAFDVCLFGALMTYQFQLATYIVLKHRFGQLEREYQSPTGIPGAVFALIIFAVALIGAIQSSVMSAWPPLLCLGLWFAFFSVYYWVYARHRLKLSPEEEFCMFMVYNIKFHVAKQRQLRHARGARHAASGDRGAAVGPHETRQTPAAPTGATAATPFGRHASRVISQPKATGSDAEDTIGTGGGGTVNTRYAGRSHAHNGSLQLMSPHGQSRRGLYPPHHSPAAQQPPAQRGGGGGDMLLPGTANAPATSPAGAGAGPSLALLSARDSVQRDSLLSDLPSPMSSAAVPSQRPGHNASRAAAPSSPQNHPLSPAAGAGAD